MVTFFKLYYEHFLFLFYISESNKFCFYLSYTMFKMKLSSENLIQTYECKQAIIQPVFIYTGHFDNNLFIVQNFFLIASFPDHCLLVSCFPTPRLVLWDFLSDCAIS